MSQLSPIFPQLLLFIGMGLCLWLLLRFEKRRLSNPEYVRKVKSAPFDSIDPLILRFVIYFFFAAGVYVVGNDVFNAIETGSFSKLRADLFFPIWMAALLTYTSHLRQKAMKSLPPS